MCPKLKDLESLSTTVMSSPGILKARPGVTRTCIKPVQQNLELSPMIDLPSGVSCSILNT